MAGKPSKPMTPFDKSVTPSYLYKWKLFLAFLPPPFSAFLPSTSNLPNSGIRWTISGDFLSMHFLFNRSANLRLIWMKMNGI